MSASEAAPDPGTPRRRRGRSAAPRPTFEQPDWRQPRLRYEPSRAISDDELEAIHLASLRVLAEIGIEVLNEEAKAIFKEAGAEVAPDGDRVRFDPGLIESQLGKAPNSIHYHARNPAHDVILGDGHIAFCMVGSAPNCADLDHGRRVGNRADYQALLRLGQVLNAVHVFGGYPVEPVDLHPGIRHLDALFDILTLGDKPMSVYSLGRERNLDGLEMVRIARGLTDEQLEHQPSCMTIINTSSPLRLDTPMAQGIIELSRRGQIVVVTPFTLAGAMAPVTIAGALVQQNAEALAGLALAQLVKPGAPFVYGGFTSNVDMKSGAPTFGTPEYMKAALVSGQLARRYGVPFRTSGVNAANAVDAQAAYESVFSLWGAIMGGGNLIKHALGWMEGGLQASFEKVVVDADLVQTVMAFLEPLEVNDATLALDAIREVGPGGHFFGCEHTQARYKTAFFAPMVSDWRNYESWQEAGAPEAAKRANQLVKDILAAYEEPPLDPAIREELEAFVIRRKAEGGAPTDF